MTGGGQQLGGGEGGRERGGGLQGTNSIKQSCLVLTSMPAAAAAVEYVVPGVQLLWSTARDEAIGAECSQVLKALAVLPSAPQPGNQPLTAANAEAALIDNVLNHMYSAGMLPNLRPTVAPG